MQISGIGKDGKPVFLRDVWPLRDYIQSVEKQFVIPAMFQEVYSTIDKGTDRWNALNTPNENLYPWSEESTYIKNPPFFDGLTSVRHFIR